MLAPLKTAEPIDEHMQKALQSDERPWHLRALVAPAMASFGSRRTQQLYHCRAVLHSNPERFSVRPRESGDPEAADWGPWIPACGGMNGGEIGYEYELVVRIRKNGAPQ